MKVIRESLVILEGNSISRSIFTNMRNDLTKKTSNKYTIMLQQASDRSPVYVIFNNETRKDVLPYMLSGRKVINCDKQYYEENFSDRDLEWLDNVSNGQDVFSEFLPGIIQGNRRYDNDQKIKKIVNRQLAELNNDLDKGTISNREYQELVEDLFTEYNISESISKLKLESLSQWITNDNISQIENLAYLNGYEAIFHESSNTLDLRNTTNNQTNTIDINDYDNISSLINAVKSYF